MVSCAVLDKDFIYVSIYFICPYTKLWGNKMNYCEKFKNNLTFLYFHKS